MYSGSVKNGAKPLTNISFYRQPTVSDDYYSLMINKASLPQNKNDNQNLYSDDFYSSKVSTVKTFSPQNKSNNMGITSKCHNFVLGKGLKRDEFYQDTYSVVLCTKQYAHGEDLIIGAKRRFYEKQLGLCNPHDLIRIYSGEDLQAIILRFPKDRLYEKNAAGETLLHMAIKLNKGTAVIKTILDRAGGAILNVRDNERNTPLHLAAADSRYCNELKEMLKMAIIDDLAFAVFRLALQHQKDLDLLKMLVKRVVEDSERDYGSFPLIYFVLYHQSADNCKALIPLFPKEDFSQKYCFRRTPPHIALYLNKGADVIEAMVWHAGKDCLNLVDPGGRTLFQAALTCDYAVVAALLRITGQNRLSQEQAKTALRYAIENIDLIAYGLAKEALGFVDYDQTEENPHKNNRISVGRVFDGFEERVLKAFEHGKDKVYQKQIYDFLRGICNYCIISSGNNDTLLHLSIASKWSEKFITLLLISGADLYLRNAMNEAPIDWFMQDEKRMAEFLPHVRHLKDSFKNL